MSAARAQELLSGPMAHVEEVVLAVRTMGRDPHWYANFGYWSSDTNRWLYGDGAQLVRLNIRTGQATNIFTETGGTIRDPCVHYDGETILFSYRPAGRRHFNLYEIRADGTGLKQITSGPWDDIEPTYTPDDGIIFCSSRCKRWVNCWYSHVAVLYRMDRDGRNLRIVSANVEHDNTPWMLPDGRVLYMRWEYIDRSQVRYHHLWTMNPDGTGQMVYFGNQNAGTAMLDAKPIPGTDKVVAIFSPGHGRRSHAGPVTIVDPNMGPDNLQFARAITRYGDCRDPYAFSEDCIMLARGAELLIMDGRGDWHTVYSLPERSYQIHEPRPLGPRAREHVIPSRVRPKELTGRLVLSDITHGRNMAGVKRGEIKKLLILESLPKPINHSGGQDTVSMGGTFTLPRVLGTVPVEPDGSAFLEVPAVRSLFFVALDEDDLSVKRMQSFVTVQPGETVSCAGCHEHRTDTPRRMSKPTVMALRRPPSRIQPFEGVPDVYDFQRHVQPILDKHCVKCHLGKEPGGGVVLDGARIGKFSRSYREIISKGLVADGRNRDGNRAPRTIGTVASTLMKKIDGSHKDVRVSAREALVVRLWIESGAPFAGTYAALGTGPGGVFKLDPGVFGKRCAGCHGDGLPNRPGKVVLDDPEKSVILLAPLARAAGGMGVCMGDMLLDLPKPPSAGAPSPKPAPRPKLKSPKPPDELDPDGEEIPEIDVVLRDLSHGARKETAPGPEPKPSAPKEMRKGRTKYVEVVFADTADPDYRKLLAGIRAARKARDAARFEAPSFRPTVHYVREMKRYGILPADFDREKDGVDVYQLDQAYWKALQWPAVSPVAASADAVPQTAADGRM